jgi:hypothetical protein
MLAILVGIHIGYRSGIPVANMTNVHMATYLRHKQIIYAYLDIPIGHITLHLCLGFTSHSLNGCIRGDRTRPTTTPTPIWRNTYQGGNLPSRPMDCQRRKCEGGVRSYGEAIPSLSGTAGGTILGRCRSAWNRSRRRWSWWSMPPAKPAPSVLPISGREGDAGHLFGAFRRA